LNWDGPITRVLAREGGWSDRAEDKGGPTNLGITLATYSKWLGRQATKDELRALQVNEARMVYLQFFVKDTNLDLIGSDALKEALFDWMVNSGPVPPVRALQRQLGLVTDGIIGQQTALAANLKDGYRLAMRIIFDRVDFIADWMRNDKRDADRDGVPDSMENAAGILKRIANQGRGLT
jgi:lysozyme family protein